MKRIIDAQKTKLPTFLQAPEKLTGCKIKHKCFVDEAKTSSMWYDGEVLSIKRAHANPINVLDHRLPITQDIHYFTFLDIKNEDMSTFIYYCISPIYDFRLLEVLTRELSCSECHNLLCIV